MGELRPVPRVGDVFSDARAGDRTMRVSWHAEAGVVVVSLWAGRVCRASFRLPAEDVPRLIETIAPATQDATIPAHPTADPATADPPAAPAA